MPKMSPDGRRCVRLDGDLFTNAEELIAALKDVAELHNVGGGPHLLDGDNVVPASGTTLRALARKHLVTARLVTDGVHGRIDYHPVEIDDRLLKMVLQGRDPQDPTVELKGGPLIARLPVATMVASKPAAA